MIAPPEGMNEADYETIEAAVMETVRGRWFLAEFARRSRVDEMRHVLDAIGRLEHVVREQQAPADPSIRLLVQRLKEVAQNLDRMAVEMRASGSEERFSASLETQARAVAGLLRLNHHAALPESQETRRAPALLEVSPVAQKSPNPQPEAARAALAQLDRLSIAEKLALFT